VTYVLIPADTSRPLEQLTVQPTLGQDVLLGHLKKAFTDGKTVDISLLQGQQPQLIGSDGAPPTVKDETLRKVASQASVEVFPLVHASPSNQLTAVNIYLDEAGMLKRLPINTRAAQYAERAGFSPPPTFYGDVFLGRLKARPLVNKSLIKGLDTDLQSAPWLQTAATENLERQMEQNRITGQDNRQENMAGTDGKEASEDGYTWTQTEEEVEVSVVIPSDADAKKDVKIVFQQQLLRVTCRKEVLIELGLFEKVDVDGCTWTIDRSGGTNKYVITMEKQEEALWPRIKD